MKILKTFSVFILLSFLMISVSNAVIRVGTGGGGLAEMHVVYLHQNLNQYLFVCVQRNNPCQLTATEFNEYKLLFERHRIDAQKYSFGFVATNPSGKVYENKNGRVSIESKALYNAASEPWELRKLLAFVVAIRLDLLPSQKSLEENYKKALYVFQSLFQNHQFHRATGSSKLLMVHLYDIQFANFRTKKVFIEDEVETYDVSYILSEKLPCGYLADWRFHNWKSTVANREVYFTADLSNQCLRPNGRHPVAVIKAELDQNNLIQPFSFQASVRY